MAVQLRLKTEQIHNLAIIRNLGVKGLESLAEKIASLKEAPLRPSDLAVVINEVVSDSDDADVVLSQLLSLYSLRRQRNLRPEEVLSGLKYGLERASPNVRWKEKELEQWRKLEPQILHLLDIQHIWVVVKALDLAYEYANLLQSARIVTDIRPIFNQEGLKVEASVVSHTLRLSYDNPQGDHSLSIALDQDDVLHLMESCKRAIKKSKAAKDLMAEQNIPTLISGEDENV